MRLRAVEDAIIEFKNIAKTVIVDLKDRVKTLEKHDEAFQQAIYSSCDSMNKAVDDKVEKACKALEGSFSIRLNTLADVYDKRIKLLMWVMAGLFGMFVGYVVYDNHQLGAVHEKINHVNENVISSSTKLDIVMAAVDDIQGDLKKANGHRWHLANELKEHNAK